MRMRFRFFALARTAAVADGEEAAERPWEAACATVTAFFAVAPVPLREPVEALLHVRGRLDPLVAALLPGVGGEPDGGGGTRLLFFLRRQAVVRDWAEAAPGDSDATIPPPLPLLLRPAPLPWFAEVPPDAALADAVAAEPPEAEEAGVDAAFAFGPARLLFSIRRLALTFLIHLPACCCLAAPLPRNPLPPP